MHVKYRFRSESSGRVLNASQICMSFQSEFYNIILSHGDGSLKNYPDRQLCKKTKTSNFKNEDSIAFCICRYINLFIAFYIFSLSSGFNVRKGSVRGSLLDTTGRASLCLDFRSLEIVNPFSILLLSLFIALVFNFRCKRK